MKVVLTEEQKNSLKLEPFIYKAILNKSTSLGDNPAIPPYGDFGLEYHVVKNKFEEVSEIIDKYIEDGELESKDTNYLLSVLSQKIVECKEKEEPIRPQLQKLCENIVNNIFAIPVETVLLECKLTDEVKPENSIRVLPENFDEFDENAYDFEDIDEVELANKAILKRRFINCLIQGFSYWLSTDIDDWHDTVTELDNDIWKLWFDIIHISDYLLFVKNEKIDDKHPKLMSYVEVKLGRLGKKTSIKAQGVILPYLLRDTIRGFLELFSSHGLPNDSHKAMYIIKKADFLVAEPWDLRLGMGIMDMLHISLTNIFQSNLLFTTQRIPYFFKALCSLKSDEFNSAMKNFLLHTKKGKIIAKEIDDKIARDVDYQKFKNRIQQKNIKTSVINDGDFSKEELDGYVLQENETDEMMAYHGSGSDFDKFNHKKYLSTGAGSQSFGWGTYVTNDEAVAAGYSQAAADKFINYVEGVDELSLRERLMNDFGLEKWTAADYADEIMDDLRFLNFDYNQYENLKGYTIYSNKPEKEIEKAKICLDVVKTFMEKLEKKAFLYEVDIPDDRGFNYLSWYDNLGAEQLETIKSKLIELGNRTNKSFLKDIIKYKRTGKEIYTYLGEIFSMEYGKDVFILKWAKKAASLFLMQCGFDGIKYPSGTKWQKPDGASEDAMNYVIFDANKVKIVNKAAV